MVGKTRILTANAIINKLNKAYPGINAVPIEEFGEGYTDGVWIKGSEDGLVDRDATPLFDYYADYSSYDSKYDIGIVYHLARWAERNGWYFEWYDAGTIMMFEN